MADGRMLKKAVSTSRKLADLKTDSARLLYTWILPHLDIEGRFSASPDIIKGYIVPRLKSMTPKKIAVYLEDLADNDLILLYSDNDDEYLELIKFKNFQTLRKDRESPSLIPPPKTSIPTPGVATENADTRQDKTNEVKLNKDKLNKSQDKGLSVASDSSFIKTWLYEELMVIDPRERTTFGVYGDKLFVHPDRKRLLAGITDLMVDCKEQMKAGKIQRTNMIRIVSKHISDKLKR
jgi:hypothetical protein